MKICYFDAFSGISGDMTVGALVDAGADREAIRSGLNSLHTGASFSFGRTTRGGIAATRFQVHGGKRKRYPHLPGIVEMIESADLPELVKRNAAAVLECLDAAQASVHGAEIDRGHFREVGSVDLICDIVAASHALSLLGIDELHTSAINIGGGNGLPVPTPATAKLLEGKPIYSRGPQFELTTATGAALICALSTSAGPLPAMFLQASGYGAGDRDFMEHANVLRVLIGDAEKVSPEGDYL